MFRRQNVSIASANRRSPASGEGSTNERPLDTSSAKTEYFEHFGVRSSILDSYPCASTGSRSLDQVLQHGGAPLGSVTLIQEHGTTDFASSLLRAFASYGVQESRDGAKSVVISVGIPDWLYHLPGVTKLAGSGKPLVKNDEASSSADRMKIAWRYERTGATPGAYDQTVIGGATSYARDLNYRQELAPRTTPREGHHVTGASLPLILQLLEQKIQQVHRPGTLIRVVVPNLLHPALYSSDASQPMSLVPFFVMLRALARKYNLVVMISMSLQLYPRSSPVSASIEASTDNCIELEPMESQDFQGFVHIHRVARKSDRGVMVRAFQEHAFKLSKTQFEVSAWGIPATVGESSNQSDTAKELY